MKPSRHGKRRTNHASDNQGGYHAGRPFQPYGDQDDGGEDQRHERHARYRVRPYDSDSVCRYGRKQESDHPDQQ